ncbi:MAG: amidohydrolase family protein [Myxococcales bacterium]|nr:amidohydrolase family protein [Myxococcales bacterium]
MRTWPAWPLWSLWPLLLLTACGGASKGASRPEGAAVDVVDPWVDPSDDLVTGVPRHRGAPADALVNAQARPIAIVGATVLTGAGQRIERGTVVLSGGAIRYVGQASAAPVPKDALILDGTGKFVTPGIIDAHSHLGVQAAPAGRGHNDGNEATAPITAQARAQYGYQGQDPQISRAMAGGVTAALILPGSANLIGGHGFTVAMKPARVTDEAAFPGAPPTLKMACGENPKRVYGEKGGPSTRMGSYATFRAAFLDANAYNAKWTRYRRTQKLWLDKKHRAEKLDAEARKRGAAPVKTENAPEPPAVDLKLETLAAVLRGEVLVQVHCYRAYDMGEMMAVASELGFTIRSFHHALDAYKIRDLLVARGIAINTWADWWGFKLEAFDGIPENAALFTEQGGRATIHSDSAIGIQRLNQEAAKARASGIAAGIAITEDQALRWITANPAWVLGIDEVTGTLEAGKRADVVLWSGSPFSVYSNAEKTIVAGEIVYDRQQGLPPSDFELGNSAFERNTLPGSLR